MLGYSAYEVASMLGLDKRLHLLAVPCCYSYPCYHLSSSNNLVINWDVTYSNTVFLGSNSGHIAAGPGPFLDQLERFDTSYFTSNIVSLPRFRDL
jgi:hypothetical protein